MSKKEIRRINTIPDWIRETIAERTITSVKKEFSIPAYGDNQQRALVTLTPDMDTGGAELSVQIGTGIELAAPADEPFRKKYSSIVEAETKFQYIAQEGDEIEALLGGNPDAAEQRWNALKENLAGESDASYSVPHSLTNSDLHTEIAEGWTIIERKGELLVNFSNEFLSNALSEFKAISSFPTQSTESVYSTGTKQHCGLDNFVVSYWGKVSTSDGNIVRHALLIDRIGGDKYFVAGVNIDFYNKLCTLLTPNPIDYDMTYDSITGKWTSGLNLKTSLKRKALEVIWNTKRTEDGSTETSIKLSPKDSAERKEVMDMLKGNVKPEDVLDKDKTDAPDKSPEESIPFEEGTSEKTESLSQPGASEPGPSIDEILGLKKEASDFLESGPANPKN